MHGAKAYAPAKDEPPFLTLCNRRTAYTGILAANPNEVTCTQCRAALAKGAEFVTGMRVAEDARDAAQVVRRRRTHEHA